MDDLEKLSRNTTIFLLVATVSMLICAILEDFSKNSGMGFGAIAVFAFIMGMLNGVWLIMELLNQGVQ